MKLFHENNTVNPEVADALSEISNVGIGKAMNTLGGLLGERITLRTPRVFSLNDCLDKVNSSEPNQIAVGILMRMTKTLEGSVLILVDPQCISDLVFKMTGTRYGNDSILENEDSLSAVQEIANMMASSYMNAIASYTGLRIYLTPMMVGLDMTPALISYPLAEMSISEENIICVDSSFSIQGDNGAESKRSGHMLILPDEESAHKMLEALGL